jgi:hypothetical protein
MWLNVASSITFTGRVLRDRPNGRAYLFGQICKVLGSTSILLYLTVPRVTDVPCPVYFEMRDLSQIGRIPTL